MQHVADETQWYLARDGQQYGPITAIEFRKLVELRHLKPTDFVWRTGFSDWWQASDVPGLLAPPPPPPMRMPPPPPGVHPPLAGFHDEGGRGGYRDPLLGANSTRAMAPDYDNGRYPRREASAGHASGERQSRLHSAVYAAQPAPVIDAAYFDPADEEAPADRASDPSRRRTNGHHVDASNDEASTAAGPRAETSTTTALVAYILQLVPIPLFPVIGIILALVNLGAKPDWLATHYRWQVRTFFIGILYAVIGALTIFFVVGGLILLFTAVWMIVRYVKGIFALNRREPIANVTTWGW
ncbi:MAG: DUF4339 domain-containing protein [Hyphomicrobiaceae bacterium]|nr:DUF4339 domain-containing protein [Hyphomicrobiaceae bacterium]